MPYNEFSIYTQPDTKYTVKQEGFATTQEFSDILAALAYVRRQGVGEDVGVKCYDPSGQVILIIGQSANPRRVASKRLAA